MDPQNALARYHINPSSAARAAPSRFQRYARIPPNPAKFPDFRGYQSLMTHFCLARGGNTAEDPCRAEATLPHCNSQR
jgi:hypothetical protein